MTPTTFAFALIQDPAAKALPPLSRPAPHSVFDYFLCTGFVGPLLLLLGAAALLIAVRRWQALRPAVMAPETLQRQLEGSVRHGQPDQALAQASASRTTLGDLVAAGLLMRGGGLDDMLANTERAAIKESLERQARVVVIARLGTTILLLSIAGTVMGLMSTMAVLSAMQDPPPFALFVGIGESLAATALGLVFALVCYQLHGMLSSSTVTRLLAVRQIAEELLVETARPRSGGA